MRKLISKKTDSKQVRKGSQKWLRSILGAVVLFCQAGGCMLLCAAIFHLKLEESSPLLVLIFLLLWVLLVEAISLGEKVERTAKLS